MATGRLAANFHTVFNLVVAALFIGFLPAMARLLVRWLPARPASADPAKPLYLDPAALQTPAVALANASREALRMADVIEKMLSGTQTTFHGDNRHLVAETSRMDDVVDRLHEALQRYIAQIAHWLDEHLKPRGVGVVLQAEHLVPHARVVEAFKSLAWQCVAVENGSCEARRPTRFNIGDHAA